MLTPEETATNYALMQHKAEVTRLLHVIVKELLDRADEHDASKMVSPELEDFAAHNAELHDQTYMGAGYTANIEGPLKRALAHHYAHNRHHPQHFKRGIEDMNLVDIIEMLVDWAASSKRHADGNLRTSIETNKGRFGVCAQLTSIFENTIELLDQ